MTIHQAIIILSTSNNPRTTVCDKEVDNYLDDLRKFAEKGYSHVCEHCGRAYYRGEEGDRAFCSEGCMDAYIQGGIR